MIGDVQRREREGMLARDPESNLARGQQRQVRACIEERLQDRPNIGNLLQVVENHERSPRPQHLDDLMLQFLPRVRDHPERVPDRERDQC